MDNAYAQSLLEEAYAEHFIEHAWMEFAFYQFGTTRTESNLAWLLISQPTEAHKQHQILCNRLGVLVCQRQLKL